MHGPGLCALLICALTAGCAKPSSPTLFRTARVLDDCAPWDGPAILLQLSNEATDSVFSTGATLRLSVWRSAHAIGSDRIDLTKDGAASRCDEAGACDPVVSGWIRFSRILPGERAVGRFSLAFADSTVQGAFDATWSKRSVMCG